MANLIIGAKPNCYYEDPPLKKYAACPLCKVPFEAYTKVHLLACDHLFCVPCLNPRLIEAQQTKPPTIPCPTNSGCLIAIQFNWEKIDRARSEIEPEETYGETGQQETSDQPLLPKKPSKKEKEEYRALFSKQPLSSRVSVKLRRLTPAILIVCAVSVLFSVGIYAVTRD